MDSNAARAAGRPHGMRRLAVALPFVFAAVRPGLAADCNGNGVSDEADLASGQSDDCDANGVPDECEALPLLVGSMIFLPLPGAAGDLAIGDLNGDGRPDLALATGAPEVTVFLDPLGAGEEIANTNVGEVLGLDCGDLDGDGDLDLAMSRGTDIRTLLNSGGGTFPSRSYLVRTGSFLGSAIADLDADGVNDVVAARGDRGAVAVFRGTGSGNFAATGEVAVDRPGPPALADLDRDGDLDVLLLDGAGSIVLLANGGGGAIGPGAPVSAGGTGNLAFAAGDLDGDGLPDLAALGASRLLVVAQGGGGAGLSLRQSYAIGAGAAAYAVAIGDPDGDGAREVVLGRTRSDGAAELQLLRLLPGGGLEAPIAVAAGGRPGSLRLADLDGDGVDEPIALQAGAPAVTIVRRGGPGAPPADPLAFRTIWRSIKRFGNFEPHMPFLADLDGDGRLDLTTMDGEFRVMVLRNQGDGTQGDEAIFNFSGGDELVAIAPADLNGDGRPDIAGVDEETNELLVLVNRGDATFVQTSQRAETDARPYFLVAADFDRDGDLDVATANEQADSVGIFRNRGDATFGAQESLAVGLNPVGLVAADFDGDGDRDLAVGKSGDFQVSILRNDRNGNFGDRVDYGAGAVSFLSGSDLDGDGDLDLVAARESENRVTVLRATGGGAFAVLDALAVGQPPRSAIAADLDRDGLPEIVTGNEDTDTISILRSIGGGSFGPPETFAVGQDPRFVVAGDLDGDGDVDLVVANHTSFDFTFFFNETIPRTKPAPRDRLCTALEYLRLAAPPAADAYAELEVPYLVPAAANPALLPTTFLPAEPGRPAWETLAALYPQRFKGLDAEGYRALVARRATRQYYAGKVLRLRLSGRVWWGFTALTDEVSTPGEGITAGEAAAIYHALAAAFLLEPFGYFPDTAESRAAARAWADPGFPVLVQESPVPFRRGDADPFGGVNISDAIAILEALFSRGTIPCEDAADANDDGRVDLSDALKVLLHLFGPSGDLPSPSRACGLDPTADDLSCFEASECR